MGYQSLGGPNRKNRAARGMRKLGSSLSKSFKNARNWRPGSAKLAKLKDNERILQLQNRSGNSPWGGGRRTKRNRHRTKKRRTKKRRTKKRRTKKCL